MIANPFDDFISADQAFLWSEFADGDKIGHLLWGDGVHITGAAEGRRLPVRARGRNRQGWVETEDLGGTPLLEIYFIYVGQGDGVLIENSRFPSCHDRWRASSQLTTERKECR